LMCWKPLTVSHPRSLEPSSWERQININFGFVNLLKESWQAVESLMCPVLRGRRTWRVARTLIPKTKMRLNTSYHWHVGLQPCSKCEHCRATAWSVIANNQQYKTV
jgi:hypothetical protein